MRFQRIQVERFGGLTGLDTGEAELPGLVVVDGPNEAGKSSLFGLLTSLIYGFYPASRDRNPHVPWDGGEIEGKANLRLDDGSLWTIHRRLLSSGWGRLARDGRVEDLRNQTLPCATHVPLGLYREVYALTLGELARLEGESWEAVQDRLMGALGAADLAPAREVWGELESRADQLWRPDRRGHPRARELAEELSSLRQRRREAGDRNRLLHEKTRVLRAVRRDLEETRFERSRIKERLERARTLLPVRRQLARARELEAEAGPVPELEALPADPSRALDELGNDVAELQGRIVELRLERSDLDRREERLTAADRRVLEQAGDIDGLAARAGAVEQAGSRAVALELEIREKERRLATQADELLSVPWSELDPQALAGIPVGPLRERVRAYRAAREDRRVREAAAEGEPGARGGLPPWVAPAMVVAGLALGAAGVPAPDLLVIVAGVALAATGALLYLGGRGNARRGSGSASVAEARRKEGEAREAALALIAGVPIHPTLAEDPGVELPSGLERLRDLLRDRQDRERALGDAHQVVAQAAQALEALAEKLESRLPTDPAAALPVLKRALDEARSREADARQARQERERLDRELARLETERERRGSKLDALERRLAGLGGGDAREGAARATARLQALERARGLRDELQRAHPDLGELQQKIDDAEGRGAGGSADEDALAKASAAEYDLTERVEALERRIAGLEKEVEHLLAAETIDDVEGAIRAVEEERVRVARERDRHFLLARLVREADRRFRDAHQPHLLRRASEHLNTVTGGRYSRLDPALVDGREVFMLEGPALPRPLEVAEPLSTGTREQVYMALRLAIVDHLDERAETLPVFIDEALVNWDRERRGRGLDLLMKASDRRQIFVFTCHAHLAGELEDRGARRIELADPERP